MTWKKYSAHEFEKLGHHNVDGQIVEFKEKLYAYGYKKPRKMPDGSERISCFPSYRSSEPVIRFMRVEGGFGSSFHTIGRMLIGKFYETLEDVENNRHIGHDDKELDWTGNTKEPYMCIWVNE